MAALETSSAPAAPRDAGGEAEGGTGGHTLQGGGSQKAASASATSTSTKEDPSSPAPGPSDQLVHDYAFEYFEQASSSTKGQQQQAAALAQLLLQQQQQQQQHGPKTPSVLTRLTKQLVSTYEGCNPGHRFRYKVPRRVLTQPKEGTLNDGRDNCEANLICSVGDVLESPKGGFTIVDLLGQGTFGQVFKCQVEGSSRPVAVKVVKNKPAYFRQAQSEVAVLKLLNEKYDPKDARHIVRLLDSFNDKNHLCLVFELLDMNVYELLKQNQFRGLPLSLIRHFVVQILSAMMVMEEANIIHCDLKPENILLVGPAPSSASNVTNNNNNNSSKPKVSPSSDKESGTAGSKRAKQPQHEIKVIDFGSACLEGHTTYTYIQSRFYRSPEVLLGLPYDMAIDLWSFGCICAEMFLGLPIFPGVSEHNQMSRIVEMLGQPPDFMLDHGTNTSKYFKRQPPQKMRTRESESILHPDVAADADDPALEGRLRPKVASSSSSTSSTSTPVSGYVLKTAEEYAADTRTPVVNSKKYFKHKKLQDIVRSYPYGRKLSKEETSKEDEDRRVFLHFILGLLELNPWKRWTAKQATDHPFVTGEPLDSSPYELVDSISVRDRRLQSMLEAQQRLCGKDISAGQGDGSQQAARTKPRPDGLHTAASYASYLNAAAVSAGRPVPSLLSRSSDPIDISQQQQQDGPSPSSFEDPHHPSIPSYHHQHHHQPPGMHAGVVGDDGMVRSAPQGARMIPQRGTTRRSSMGQSMSGWHAHEGSTGGYTVRTSRASFAGHKGGESYTYEASERATDFGYALQRPGVMIHFSPQQQSGAMGFVTSGGAGAGGYGGYGDVIMMNGGRPVVAGTSPHANGFLGRSWGQHGGQPQQQAHFQPASSGGMAMRSPAQQQQYMQMPPPQQQQMGPPPPPGYYGGGGMGGPEEEEGGVGRHGQVMSPSPADGTLDGSMAEWDPFFPEGLDEEMATPSSQGGGGGGHGGGSHPEFGSPGLQQQPPQGPPGRSRSAAAVRGGKDFYGVSPKQHNSQGMGRGASPHHQQGPSFNTPPRFFRGPLSNARGPPSSSQGGGIPPHRQRNSFSNSPQSWKFQPPGGSSSGSYSSARHRQSGSWHHPVEQMGQQPQSLPDSLSKVPPPQSLREFEQQQQYGAVPMVPYWSGGGSSSGGGQRRRVDQQQQQQPQHGGGGRGGWGGGGGGGRRTTGPAHGMSGLTQELQQGTSPSSSSFGGAAMRGAGGSMGGSSGSSSGGGCSWKVHPPHPPPPLMDGEGAVSSEGGSFDVGAGEAGAGEPGGGEQQQQRVY